MLIYISKYALSEGILELQGKDVGRGMAMIPPTDTAGFTTYYKRGEWHTTREEAVARAEDMCRRRIASLRRQIAKLEKLRFDGG